MAQEPRLFSVSKPETKIMDFVGTSNDDTLDGTESEDSFDMTLGGDDHVSGLAGDDLIHFGGTLTANDRIDGGLGYDEVTLQGDYSLGLTITKAMMQNVEVVRLLGGFNYTLTIEDRVANGIFNVDASDLGPGVGVILDAHAVRRAEIQFEDSSGNDVFIGGRHGGPMDMIHGGDDICYGGGGNDGFRFSSTFTLEDGVDGGRGEDYVSLDGDYSLKLKANTFHDVERLILHGGSFSITMADGTLRGNDYLLVNALSLDSHESLIFDGTAETDRGFTVEAGGGSDVIDGGAEGDNLSGGGGTNTIRGRGGDDNLWSGGSQSSVFGGAGDDTIYGTGLGRLSGGRGSDIFQYFNVAASTGRHYDTIVDFDAGEDFFQVFRDLAGINPWVTVGALSVDTIDEDLEVALGNGELLEEHAVLITASDGDLSGGTFLVIDYDGEDGYREGSDFVIEIENGTNLGSLSAENFF
jgi:Ca2+-binding RTX toxin-like protein